ncbi:TerC family protein [Telmatospirillum siberiense]|uniref:TerC family protein n=1 Tax=Telmatospirillum siberiense TaxID=382514 RepID=UPI001F538061|nr:TerC family protein [Telmatospirillum siberiense]
MEQQAYFLVAFAVLVGGLLAVDLGIFHRRSHPVRMREALIWSGVWIATALAFNLALVPWRGSEAALQFLTGYLIELSLSVDNLFVFLLLFTRFAVPPALQHRVLFWGVIGAIVMRVAMIVAGGVLVDKFHGVLYLFGLFLAVTGVRMVFSRDKETDPVPITDRFPMSWLRRHLPLTDTPHDGRFVVKIDGRRMVTPLFLVLISVEIADLMFAVDSIPAIFAITTDPFVVATSNIFAILGLRSLYFALSGLTERLRYLKYGLALVLMFIGAKILLADLYPIPIVPALAITAFILAVAAIASLVKTRREETTPRKAVPEASH